MGLSEADVQDVAQEAMLRGWRSRHSLRGSRSRWMAVIARNEALRHRARLVHHLPEEALAGHAVADRAEQSDLRVDVARSVQELGASDRTMLEMHYRLGLSYETLAKCFDLPVGTVKVRLHRARRKLRPHLVQEVS